MTTPLVRAICKNAPGVRHDFCSFMPSAVTGVSGIHKRIDMFVTSLDEVRDRYDKIHYLCYEHAPELHVVDGYCVSTGFFPDDKTLTYVVTEQERRLARALLGEEGKKGAGRLLIGIQAGGVDVHRTYPLHRVQELIDLIAKRLSNVTIVALAAEPLVLRNCINLCGAIKRTRTAAAVVSLFDYFVATDSGFLHVAQALSIPTVAIFGATLPELRVTRPETVHVVREDALSCLGCYHHIPPYSERLTECRRGDIACMRALSAETVWKQLRELMRGATDEALYLRLENYERVRVEFFERRYSEAMREAIKETYDRRVSTVRHELRQAASLLQRSKAYLRSKLPAFLYGE